MFCDSTSSLPISCPLARGCFSHWPGGNWLQKVQIVSPSPPDSSTFSVQSTQSTPICPKKTWAGWCFHLGVSQLSVDLPASIFSHLSKVPRAGPEFQGVYSDLSVMSAVLRYLFGIPRLTTVTASFGAGPKKGGLQTQIPPLFFTHFFAVVNTEERKRKHMFFEYHFFLLENRPFETGAPRKLAPRLIG